MIFRLEDEGYLRENSFDTYRVEFSIRKPTASAESSLIFHANSFVCSRDYAIPITQINTDPSVNILTKIDWRDSNGNFSINRANVESCLWENRDWFSFEERWK